jgi:hypothetical protein
VTVRGRPHSRAVGAFVREAKRVDCTAQQGVQFPRQYALRQLIDPCIKASIKFPDMLAVGLGRREREAPFDRSVVTVRRHWPCRPWVAGTTRQASPFLSVPSGINALSVSHPGILRSGDSRIDCMDGGKQMTRRIGWRAAPNLDSVNSRCLPSSAFLSDSARSSPSICGSGPFRSAINPCSCWRLPSAFSISLPSCGTSCAQHQILMTRQTTLDPLRHPDRKLQEDCGY